VAPPGGSGVFASFLLFGGLLNLHIPEFFGIEDLSALQAFDELGVFMPGDDSYLWVFAGGRHCLWIEWGCCSFRKIVAVFCAI